MEETGRESAYTGSQPLPPSFGKDDSKQPMFVSSPSFGKDYSKQPMFVSSPTYDTYYMSINRNTPYSVDDIIDRIKSKTITKEIVDRLKQKRDTVGSSKKFFQNFNSLVNRLYQESENDASKRSILESVGFFPDSSIIEDDGYLL